MTQDFEHEGPLSDPAVQRAGDRRAAEATRVLGDNLRRLSTDEDFLLWFQRYAYPMLAVDFAVSNGSLLAHFMGKRQLVTQIVKEMDDAVPGFLGRVIAARDDYESRLDAAEEK